MRIDRLAPGRRCPAATTEGRCIRRYGPEQGDHVHRTADGTFWAVRKIPRTYLEALAAEWAGRRRDMEA